MIYDEYNSICIYLLDVNDYIYIYSLRRKHLYCFHLYIFQTSISFYTVSFQGSGDLSETCYYTSKTSSLGLRWQLGIEQEGDVQGDFCVIVGDHWAFYLIIWVWKCIIHLPTTLHTHKSVTQL